MTAQAKKTLVSYLIWIPAVSLLVGGIFTFATTANEVKQNKEAVAELKKEQSLNSEEHKAIMAAIGNIDKNVVEIKTRIDICMPTAPRYAFTPRRRDTAQ